MMRFDVVFRSSEAAENTGAICIEWKQFPAPHFRRSAELVVTQFLVGFHKSYPAEEVVRRGFSNSGSVQGPECLPSPRLDRNGSRAPDGKR